MWTFLIRRLWQSFIVLIGVTVISFVALQIGGDPTYLFVSENATTEEIDRAREMLGFDRPLHVQYLDYVWNALQGDFGNSLSYRQPAMSVVLEAMPATIELTIFSLVLAIGLSIPLGIYAALKRGKPIDGGIMTFAMLGQSIPNFWMGIMMIMFFGLYLRWFPISGHVPFLEPLFEGDLSTAFSNLPRSLHYMVMPALAVGTYTLARNARLIRSAMLESLQQDYVRTARSKGISERRVIFHHAMRNAWLPVVTMIGLEFGFLLGGVVVVETVFSYPGIGRLVFQAISARDLIVVESVVMLLVFAVIVVNFAVDLAYAAVDPRLRARV